MKITYYLRSPELEETNISFRFYLNRKAVKRSTGIKVKSKAWDDKNQKIRPSYTNSTRINVELSKLQSEVMSILLENQFESSTKKIQEVDNYLRKKDKVIVTISDLFEVFLEERLKLKDYSEGTVKIYQTTLRKIQSCGSGLANTKISNIDYPFFMDFFNQLNDQGVQNITVNKYIRKIRHVLHWGFENNYHDNHSFSSAISKVFKNFDFNSDSKVALTNEELKRLENLDLVKESQLEFYRDLFLIQTYLCLRYSELKQVNSSKVSGDEIFLYSKKTKQPLKRPVFSKSLHLLKKYDLKNLRYPAEQVLNRNLKKICKRAEIDEMILKRDIVGRNVSDEMIPKYELVSNHSARNTFITICLENGMIPEEVQKITGHKNIKTLLSYVKTTEKRAFDKVKSLWEG